MTTTVAIERVPPMRARPSRRRIPDPDEPVYAALAAQWHQEGRMVPGERDWEWVDAVARKAWR
jgi:hypothetical protein